MSQRKSNKKPTTSKKKLRRQAQKMEPRDLMDKMLKEKPQLAGKLIRNPPGKKKMSEVILDYAEPLMEHAENVEQQQKAITMAIICWNASLLSGEDRDRILAGAFAETGDMEDSGIQEVLQFMLIRKQELFAHDKRMVADWIVKDKGDRLTFEVATILPKEDANR